VLEAVEAAILKCIACSSCAVMAVGAEGEDKRLVAYIVPADESNRQGMPMSVAERGGCGVL
jgi:hypothetical protein